MGYLFADKYNADGKDYRIHNIKDRQESFQDKRVKNAKICINVILKTWQIRAIVFPVFVISDCMQLNQKILNNETGGLTTLPNVPSIKLKPAWFTEPTVYPVYSLSCSP